MRHIQSIFIGAAMAAALPSTSFAQSVVGTAVVDGQEVELLSNNTWRFAADIDLGANCAVVDAPIAFCGAPTRWQRAPAAPSPAVDALYQLDDRNFGMLIVDGIGRADGLDVNGLRDSVLLNAGAAAGTPGQAVPVLETFESEVEGKPYSTVSYQVQIQGLSFVYQTTLYVDDNNAAQFTTYAVGNALTDGQRAIHEEFLSLIRIAQ